MSDWLPFCGEDRWPCSYEEAAAVVLPLPYEGTVSYGAGASRGPGAILAASGQLEMYDEELDRRIDRAGLYTLPAPELAGGAPEAVMQRIHEAALPAVRDGKLVAGLGGEHSVSYGLFTALLEARGRPFSILQIDAHADLRDTYDGTPHSHACIMARAHELGLPFAQVGIRSLSEPERHFLRETGLERNVFWAHRILPGRKLDWIDHVIGRLGPEVYVTIDIDGLDPSIVPATGTPEPGGLDWYTTLALLRAVARQRRIVGLDLTELAPVAGFHAPDFLAARLVYKALGYALFEGPGARA